MKKLFLNQLNGTVLSKDQLKSVTGMTTGKCHCGGNFYISCGGVCNFSGGNYCCFKNGAMTNCCKSTLSDVGTQNQ